MQVANLKIISVYLLTGMFQMLWHWLISKDFQEARNVLAFYLYRDVQSGKSVSGYLDFLLPALLCGVPTGWLCWDCQPRKLYLYTFAAAAGICALTPLYTLVLDKTLMWWWPKTATLSGFAIQFLKTAVMVGMFAHAGRCFGQYSHRSAEEVHS
jgi:hypothetical protein